MCRRMSPGNAFGRCAVVVGACGLATGRFAPASALGLREMCRRMSWRSRPAIRAICVDGCGGVTYERCRCRVIRGSRIRHSSEGLPQRLHVAKQRMPRRDRALPAFNVRDVPPRMQGSAGKYVAACRHDTLPDGAPRAPIDSSLPHGHATASPAALPDAACPRSARTTHAFVVPKNTRHV